MARERGENDEKKERPARDLEALPEKRKRWDDTEFDADYIKSRKRRPTGKSFSAKLPAEREKNEPLSNMGGSAS